MARRSISIDEKIAGQKEQVTKAKEKYELALDKLKVLMDKKRDLEGKALLNGFVKSTKSLEEILTFMSGENDGHV